MTDVVCHKCGAKDLPENPVAVRFTPEPPALTEEMATFCWNCYKAGMARLVREVFVEVVH